MKKNIFYLLVTVAIFAPALSSLEANHCSPGAIGTLVPIGQTERCDHAGLAGRTIPQQAGAPDPQVTPQPQSSTDKGIVVNYSLGSKPCEKSISKSKTLFYYKHHTLNLPGVSQPISATFKCNDAWFSGNYEDVIITSGSKEIGKCTLKDGMSAFLGVPQKESVHNSILVLDCNQLLQRKVPTETEARSAAGVACKTSGIVSPDEQCKAALNVLNSVISPVHAMCFIGKMSKQQECQEIVKRCQYTGTEAQKFLTDCGVGAVRPAPPQLTDKERCENDGGVARGDKCECPSYDDTFVTGYGCHSKNAPKTEDACKKTTFSTWDATRKVCLCESGKTCVAQQPVPTPVPQQCQANPPTCPAGQQVSSNCTCVNNPPLTPAQCTADQDDKGINAQGQRVCEAKKACFTACGAAQECQNGKCVDKQQTQTSQQDCQQKGGQLQGTTCYIPQQNPNANQNQNQQEAQQCVQKGGTWANNKCLPGTPNAQQPKPTPQQQQQAAQQAAQQQQQQAQQQCLAQGGQWNGQQCLPPAFNPYTSPYYNQQVAQKPACNFFGASRTEVPFGETVDVTWEVTGASTISLDTSPKSSTKYIKGDASTQSNSALGTITNSINSPLIQPTAPQSTIIGATVKPSKKGTLTVRLKVNNLLQNSDPCKPLKLKVVDPAEISAVQTEDTSQNYSSTANQQVTESYLDQGTSNNSSGIGEEVELASDIARQKREAAAEVQRNNAEAKPEVTKATYENLCALFGIGCGGAEETAALSNPVETVVARGSASTTTPVERLTINPGDVGVDVPNVGSGDNTQTSGGFTTTTQTVYQDGGTTVVAYDPQQATDNAVAGYVQDTAKYAPDGIAPQATSNGQLKQEAVAEDTAETKKVGVFSRMWGWFMNLLGFGPEQV